MIKFNKEDLNVPTNEIAESISMIIDTCLKEWTTTEDAMLYFKFRCGESANTVTLKNAEEFFRYYFGE